MLTDNQQNVPCTEESYLKTRLDDQIEWYSNKSSIAQKKYKLFQTIEIIVAALIPVIVCIGLAFDFLSIAATISTGAIGSIIVIIEAVCKMNKYHENWIEYRHVSEVLKHEKYLYLTRTSPYDLCENPLNTLVSRTEQIISAENINWVGINNTDCSN